MYKKLSLLIGSILCLFILSNIYIYLIDPFHAYNIIQKPFTVADTANTIVLHKNFDLHVIDNPLTNDFGYYLSGLHILLNTYFGSRKAKGTTDAQIIATIHTLRFNPKQPYLISGDHFTVLYPRNLGIFYASILNSHTALSQTDWQDREEMYLKTTAYSLAAFTSAKTLATTIVPISPKSVTLINIYAYPSDSLFGVLYALKAMQTPQPGRYPLETATAAAKLTSEYKDSLRQLFYSYKQTVYDPKTGLIKKNIHLSSARDSSIRESAFYDNVIYWDTAKLVSELGIVSIPQKDLDDLRARILTTFWDEKDGYFLNDLSGTNQYSSDWLIVLTTGFLSPNNRQDLSYLEKPIAYIEKNNIDQPFGLKYQAAQQASQEFPFVRYFVPSYGQNAIWSHWGMEYIKTLIALYNSTKDPTYLQRAQQQLTTYQQNIVKFHGYPETYNEHGKFLKNWIYTSIRQTGWVVNFEEAEYLLSQAQSK